jgi:DNA-binding CsgD family transcriptional regulator
MRGRRRDYQPIDPDAILHLAALGHTDQEIANSLSTTRKAISRHLKLIRDKTGIHNRILLAFYTLGKGIVTPDDVKAAIKKQRRVPQQ